MQMQVRRGRPKRYLSLAGRLINDRTKQCRWAAAILIQDFIPFFPDDVWEIVRTSSNTANPDLRDALATVILEHLLEWDFDRVIARIREELVQRNRSIGQVAAQCWNFTGSKVKWARLEKLLKQFAEV
jgi:hypothetical protein